MKTNRPIYASLLLAAQAIFFKPSAALAQERMLAPDTISTGDVFGLTLTPDGQTSFFVKAFGGREKLVIFQSEMKNGRWQKPEAAPFSYSDGRYRDIDPVVSPDGKLVLFNSNRPLPGKSTQAVSAQGVSTPGMSTTGVSTPGDFNIWASRKTAQGWGAPFVLSDAMNSDSADIYAGMALSGNVYFGSRRAGGLGGMDLYVSTLENGSYQTPLNLGPEVNSAGSDSNPCIAPDESYLIYASGLPNAKSLMVSFRINSRWSSPMELPVTSNPTGTVFCPMVDIHSNTFYFARTRVENGKRIENIYSMPLSALHLDSLRARSIFLSDYAGTYQIEAAGGIRTIRVWKKDGKLYGSADDQQTLQLLPTEIPDQMLIAENGEKINFTRNNSKQVQSLKIQMPDGEVTAVKQE